METFWIGTLLLLLGEALISQGQSTTKAALIIGGYQSSSQEGVLSHTELFGCANSPDNTIQVAPFPMGTYLLGATLVEEEGQSYVLACGGYNCDEENVCVVSDMCYSWNPIRNEWTEHSTLNAPRFAIIIEQVVNINDNSAGEQTKSPIVMGYDFDTEILNKSSGLWESYYPLPDKWYSVDCIVQYGEKLFTIRRGVQELDTTTWEVQDIQEVPLPLQFPSKCARLILDDEDGIFTRYGNWFNLETEEWEFKKPPPFNPVAPIDTNAMWTFNGKPTIFGNPICMTDGTCEYREVVQYDPSANEWVSLGSMLKTRSFHEVVEVPQEFCDYFIQPTTTDVSTTTDETYRPNVAFIIGGYKNSLSGGILNHTELFGCTNTEEINTPMAPFPSGVYFLGAMMVEIDGEPSVLACGGYSCDKEDVCESSEQCWSWNPKANEWKEHSQLQRPRFAHIIDHVPLINDTTSPKKQVPIVMGYYEETEVYNDDSGTWEPYLSLPTKMYSVDCFVHYEDTLYNIRRDIYELDTTTWEVTDLGQAPLSLRYPTKCSPLTINGQRGIYTRFGYWLNLRTKEWETRMPPPHNFLYPTDPNAMWSLNGKPTIFGHPTCDNQGKCTYQEVLQYDPDEDKWNTLGQMLEPRLFHEVVEVPAEFCDYFAVSTTAPTETTTDGTTEDPTGPPNSGSLKRNVSFTIVWLALFVMTLHFLS